MNEILLLPYYKIVRFSMMMNYERNFVITDVELSFSCDVQLCGYKFDVDINNFDEQLEDNICKADDKLKNKNINYTFGKKSIDYSG